MAAATYASVAAQNAPPPSDQPHPDPSLLTTESENPDPVPDLKTKVAIVPTDFKEGGRRGGRRSRETAAEGTYLWRRMKHFLFQPEVAGGLVGLLNTAVIGTVAYYGYRNWDKPRWNRQVVASVSVGLLALWGAEGYIAEKFSERHRR
ncbi:hypothetical protein EV401DRAFT_1330479 [Pisolithus croceorrhizus]|nr:hypothetical protein EV401DRAFT_1330479 [Pisolithus croceorrhizus]